MKITLKTIRQQTFKVEIGDDATVQELKDKIEAENRDYPSKQLKLIYSGKILQDSESLSEYKISESSFVVVMVSKAKAPQPSSSAPKPVTTRTPPTQTATEQPSPMQSSSRQPTDSTMETEGTDSVLSRDQQTTATTTAPSQPQDRSSQPPTANVPSQEEEVVSPQESSLAQASSTLAVGDQYVDAVMSLIALGYDRSEVERAMAASFNNPDRAFDYLENGIPESAFRDQPSAQEGPVDQPGGEPGEEMEGEEPQVSQDPPPLRQPQEVAAQEQVQGRGNNPLAFLRSLPQFRTMQQAIQRNPHMLQGMLEELGQSYPQLLQIISQNQEAFLQLMNENPGGPGSEAGVREQARQQRRGQGIQIHVNAEEQAAINRLKALGFDEALVIQAYFACEKDEEKAVNLLFQMTEDGQNDV